jgi:hypothetical protein
MAQQTANRVSGTSAARQPLIANLAAPILLAATNPVAPVPSHPGDLQSPPGQAGAAQPQAMRLARPRTNPARTELCFVFT